jgi:hypothetical protein
MALLGRQLLRHGRGIWCGGEGGLLWPTPEERQQGKMTSRCLFRNRGPQNLANFDFRQFKAYLGKIRFSAKLFLCLTVAPKHDLDPTQSKKLFEFGL